MTVSELRPYLDANWSRVREDIVAGTYEPAPVRRVEIPKPGGQGVRFLGIPRVLDRFLQQSDTGSFVGLRLASCRRRARLSNRPLRIHRFLLLVGPFRAWLLSLRTLRTCQVISLAFRSGLPYPDIRAGTTPSADSWRVEPDLTTTLVRFRRRSRQVSPDKSTVFPPAPAAFTPGTL